MRNRSILVRPVFSAPSIQFDSPGLLITVAIDVPNTVTGITAEVLTIIVTTDALAQAVAAADTEYTLEAAHTLKTLRQELGF